MGWLDSIKSTFFQGGQKKQVKDSQQLVRELVPYSKAQSIGILLNATSETEAAIVLEYTERLRKDHKQLSLLAYIDQDEISLTPPYYEAFCKKDLGWSKAPKGDKVQAFTQQNFDVLLSLHTQICEPLEHLALISTAKCRIGCYREENTDAYDVLFRLPENDGDLRDFIQLLDTYWKKF